MLNFDKKTFELVIKSDDPSKEMALADYASMNDKFKSMGDYIENKDTPKAEKEKYEPLYIIALQALTQAELILKAMGIQMDKIRQLRKF